MGNGKENRHSISGGILQTLQQPLFITKNNDSYYFYKPFKNKDGLLHLVSVGVDSKNNLKYKTSYNIKDSKLGRIIKDFDLIYFAGGAAP